MFHSWRRHPWTHQALLDQKFKHFCHVIAHYLEPYQALDMSSSDDFSGDIEIKDPFGEYTIDVPLVDPFPDSVLSPGPTSSTRDQPISNHSSDQEEQCARKVIRLVSCINMLFCLYIMNV